MKAKILIDNHAPEGLTPEWGLSVYIEHREHRILLDTGAGAQFAENAEKMGVDLASVEFGVLSHAHYDHADGMAAFFQKNQRAKFYLQSSCGENCYGTEDGKPAYIGIRPGTLAAFADRIVYTQGNTQLYPGATLLPHRTPNLESIGRKAGMFVQRDGVWCPDCFDHEQSLVLETEKGLVIFNSCSHGGAENIINETAAAFPERRIYALVGGLHLYQTTDEEVRALAADMRRTGIEKIITGHCTGDAAMSILQKELGDMVTPLCTGMEIEF